MMHKMVGGKVIIFSIPYTEEEKMRKERKKERKGKRKERNPKEEEIGKEGGPKGEGRGRSKVGAGILGTLLDSP